MPTVPSSPRVKLRATSRRVPRERLGKATVDAPEAEPEPNMKLSRALAVVLLLHVVAIGGIIAFSLIKDHNPSHLTSDDGPANAAVAEDAHLPGVVSRDSSELGPRPAVHVVRQGETLTRIANANGVSLAALLAANASSATAGIHPGQELVLPEKVSTPVRPNEEALNLIEQKSTVPDDADIAAVNLTPPNGAGVTGSAAKSGKAPGDSGQTYTVGKGESPYAIAQKFKVTPAALLKLNGINDPTKIKPGQKLKIPTKPAPEIKPNLNSKSKLKA